MKPEVTVLIPAYNEEDYIGGTIFGARASGSADRIIVVDDGSTDDTAMAAARSGAEVLRIEGNRGKGYALNYGLERIKSGIVVFIDADIGQSAVELQKLVAPVVSGEADMTIGVLPPALRRGGFGLVKKLADTVVKRNTGRKLSACLSGQRAAKREMLSALGPVPAGFAAEIGLNVKALTKGYRVKEVPVNMFHRESGRNLKGFMHRGKQFMDILLFCLREGRDV
ncbi:MAG TPA: glycosyltransferase family 2 protein [Bacillota bacterium]|jgi:glycosyltransferase involved in cell wall biosynthesis|nr:glycosyltransferase family 2 protein [Bacillota bacterium]